MMRVMPVGNARWRPRDGHPRSLSEVAAQFVWRYRSELFAIVVASVSLALLFLNVRTH